MANRITKLLRETWLLWLYGFCLGFISGREDETAPMSRHVEMISSLAFGFLVAMWVYRDARRREHSMGFGFPALVFLLWPIFGPLYLFQTRGVRALLTLLIFIAMIILSMGLGAIIGIMTLS